MDDRWTLPELTEEAAKRIAALPPPKNGQVRAVPDLRTIRYYATLGLIDKPTLRGRVALYGKRHLAQVVSIKRLQSAGRSLSEIQSMWPTMDDDALGRMSGVGLKTAAAKKQSRSEFWKRAPESAVAERAVAEPAVAEPIEEMWGMAGEEDEEMPPGVGHLIVANVDGEDGEFVEAPPVPQLELRVLLAPGIVLSLAVPDGVSPTPDDVRALRAAASPLIELASRRLGLNDGGEDR